VSDSTADRWSQLALPPTVFVVDVTMGSRQRRETRATLMALEAVHLRPNLLLGSRGAGPVVGCRLLDCGPPLRRWIEAHERLRGGTIGENFDRLFDASLGAPASTMGVLRALEEARFIPVKTPGGLPRSRVIVFAPGASLGEIRKLADEFAVAPENLGHVRRIADFVCGELGRECTLDPPPIPHFRGQRAFRIYGDSDGRPSRASSIPIGETFGSAPEAIDVVAFHPYITALTLDWTGGDRAAVFLTGELTEDFTPEFYDVDITLDGAPAPYRFNGSDLIVDLTERGPGRHVLEVRISGGQLLTPLEASATHSVDWIADFGTLAPGDGARCIPMARDFGPLARKPFFLNVVRRGDELCASVSLASLSAIAEWPRWEGSDGAGRELRVVSEPSPILWVVLLVLMLASTLALRRVLHLLSLRRRPTHIVVKREDEAGYRQASNPERIVRLAPGPLADLAPELRGVDATLAVDAVVTISAASELLLKRHGTAPTEKVKRVILPAGSTLAFEEVQVAFVDEGTAARIEAREFRALPVFSAAELQEEPGDRPRDLAPVLEAIVWSLPVVGICALGVSLASTAVPVLGTYAGFSATTAAILGGAYLVMWRALRTIR